MIFKKFQFRCTIYRQITTTACNFHRRHCLTQWNIGRFTSSLNCLAISQKNINGFQRTPSMKLSSVSREKKDEMSEAVPVKGTSLPSRPLTDKLVVIVLGSTASGKSKLAIDLAKHVNGEIISADSMQVYDGLDIVTNKATEEEMMGIPHHMISVVNRTEKFDVVQFRDKALPLVEKILSEDKIPFIVGGTNYYIESLLWKILMDDRSASDCLHVVDESLPSVPCTKFKSDSPSSSLNSSTTLFSYMQEKNGNFHESDLLSKWSHTEIHSSLQEIDPFRASKIHPNDIRKVVRSLQVYFRTGRKHSELIEEQLATVSSDSEEDIKIGGENNDNDTSRLLPTSLTGKVGGPLRFPNSICFWIQADRKILNERINKRVDQMVERGLKEELDCYVDRALKENWKWDFEEGQLQSIGVKEFRSYIQLPPEERSTEVGQKSLEEGLERLKIVTRQYAKRQVQWIRQRFFKSSRRQLPRVYGLDGNDVDELSWERNVTSPAMQILDAHLIQDLNTSVVQKNLLPVLVENEESSMQDFISRRCEVCNKILLGNMQYQEHINSQKHWKMIKRKKRMEEMASTTKFVSTETETSGTLSS